MPASWISSFSSWIFSLLFSKTDQSQWICLFITIGLTTRCSVIMSVFCKRPDDSQRWRFSFTAFCLFIGLVFPLLVSKRSLTFIKRFLLGWLLFSQEIPRIAVFLLRGFNCRDVDKMVGILLNVRFSRQFCPNSLIVALEICGHRINLISGFLRSILFWYHLRSCSPRFLMVIQFVE